jgi:hypothetical protein
MTLAVAAGIVLSASTLRWVVAVTLLTFGVQRLFRHRHPRWASMRVGFNGLTLWSFLMASAHGAGLMVVPIFLGMTNSAVPAHACHVAVESNGTMWASVIATALHAAGYLAITAIVSVVVFEKFGVGLLRKAWLNLDVMWAASLITAGVVTLLI